MNEATSKTTTGDAQAELTRQAANAVIRKEVEQLNAGAEGLVLEIQRLKEAPAELTPATTAEYLVHLAEGLGEVIKLFRAHLAWNHPNDSDLAGAEALGRRL